MAQRPPATGGDFISNLGKVYGFYTVGFAIFLILLAILEQVGVPHRIVGYLFVFFTLAVYAAIGILSRTMQVPEFYVAGRRVPSTFNGMATAGDWMSGASFVGLAGSLYVLGYDGLAFVLGATGGFVLVAVLVAPYLRKLGAYTVPDFLAVRFGGGAARLAGVVVLLSCSFVYAAAQLSVIGIVAARFLGIPYDLAVIVGVSAVVLCSLLGGMRAVTWTQVAQYIVLIIAYLVPVVLLSAERYGLPIPQLTYGQALQEITAIERQIGVTGANGAALATVGQFTSHVAPFSTTDPFNYFALIVCLMAGTASLPHLLMRFFTTSSVRDARSSVGWSLVFVVILFATAPAYAAFMKLEVLQNVVGTGIAELPRWVYSWGGDGLVKICGVAATNPDAVAVACGTQNMVLRPGDIMIDPDVVVLATPEMAGLPFVVVGLVAAGAIAAALSTADGLLLAIANALSHDVYHRMIDRRAPTSRRLFVARILLLLAAGSAAWLATIRPADILAMMAWAFSLAAAGNFPALVLGIWWKRCTARGAVAGMLAGFGVTLFYLLMTNFGGMPLWPIPGVTSGVESIAAAIFGLPVGFLVTIVVSSMTPEPSAATKTLVDDIRRPSGDVVLHSG